MLGESPMASPTRPRIGATLSSAGAARRWDVVVIGAGCAGPIAARELARAGCAVLLVDRAHFPRSKVCGCCLNAAALGVLAGVGLGDLPARLGAVPLRMLSVACRGARARLSIPAGAALSRESLDAALIGAAIEAGAAFLPGCSATVREAPGNAQPSTAGGAMVEVGLREAGSAARDGEPVASARCVIVADGLAGTSLTGLRGLPIARQRRSLIGAATILPGRPDACQAGVIMMTVGVGGYVGMVRLEDGRLNVAAAIDPRAAHDKGGIAAVVGEILAQAGAESPAGLLAARWQGTTTLTRRRAVVQSGNILVIGDAAGYVEPFTGEGMAWALASGISASGIACSVVRDGEEARPEAWSEVHASVIASRQRVCRAVSWTLRRPVLAETVVRVLARWPGIASPVLHRLAAPFMGGPGPETPIGRASPAATGGSDAPGPVLSVGGTR